MSDDERLRIVRATMQHLASESKAKRLERMLGAFIDQTKAWTEEQFQLSAVSRKKAHSYGYCCGVMATLNELQRALDAFSKSPPCEDLGNEPK